MTQENFTLSEIMARTCSKCSSTNTRVSFLIPYDRSKKYTTFVHCRDCGFDDKYQKERVSTT